LEGINDYVKKIEWLRSNGQRMGADCPPAEDMASLIEVMLKGRSTIGHIIKCPDCLFVFTELLRMVTGTIGPPFWKQQGLSSRTANALARAGILTWMDLWSRKAKTIPGIGKGGAKEIARLMKRLEVDPD
jgi:hypothetical protein